MDRTPVLTQSLLFPIFSFAKSWVITRLNKNRVSSLPRTHHHSEVFMSLRSALLLSVFTLVSGSAFAASSTQLSFQPGTQTVDLSGESYRTLYREEQYETTCYRDEEYTEYRSVCDYRDEQSCTSRPVCRDVSRPVCNSNGCTDYPTRECTTEESCTTSRVETNCRSEPYTATRSVPYSCIQTRMVPYGTELVQRTTANVTVHFTGELTQASAAEVFALSVANGTDSYGPDFSLVSVKSSNDYIFVRREISPAQITRNGLDVSMKRVFEVRSFSVARIISENSVKITRMFIDRRGIDVDVTASQPEALVYDLNVQRDRVLGSHLTIYRNRVPQNAITVTSVGGGNYKVRIDFAALGGMGINNRPHLYGLTISMGWSIATTDGELMNEGASARLQNALKTNRVIRASL